MDFVIDTVLIVVIYFYHWDSLRILKPTKDGRERYASYIKPTLQNPFEVWLSEYLNEKGEIELRKSYIGLFKDKELNEDIFIVLRQEKDSFVFWNAFERDRNRIDKLRKGYLKYWKK